MSEEQAYWRDYTTSVLRPTQQILCRTPNITMEALADRTAYVRATNKDGIAILEATATWCSQRKAIAPFVEKMRLKYPDARFYTYDTDTAEDIAQELAARAMPTFSIFKDGDLMDSITGAKPEKLEKAIKDIYDGKVVGDE